MNELEKALMARDCDYEEVANILDRMGRPADAKRVRRSLNYCAQAFQKEWKTFKAAWFASFDELRDRFRLGRRP